MSPPRREQSIRSVSMIKVQTLHDRFVSLVLGHSVRGTHKKMNGSDE